MQSQPSDHLVCKKNQFDNKTFITNECCFFDEKETLNRSLFSD